MKLFFGVLFFGTLSLAFVACGDDDDKNVEQPEVNKEKVIVPDSLKSTSNIFRYVYDANLQIDSIIDTGSFPSKTKIKYDAEGNVTSFYREMQAGANFIVQNRKFEVTKDTIFENREQKFGASPTATFKYKHVMSGTKDIQKTIALTDNEDIFYKYDTAGNLTEIEYRTIGSSQVKSKTVYTFENKNGAFKNVKAPKWFKTSYWNVFYNGLVNNMTSRQIGINPKIEYTLEYNTDNYPTKMTDKSNAETKFVYTKK